MCHTVISQVVVCLISARHMLETMFQYNPPIYNWVGQITGHPNLSVSRGFQVLRGKMQIEVVSYQECVKLANRLFLTKRALFVYWRN